ncbi:unnamed protein product [Parnassius mnemosyne]|uniref:Regulatory protein zeste n=1 Tax=Parnassius mnemosyne TaxID=213953 RepID=A0AAV1L6P1_9NEOP
MNNDNSFAKKTRVSYEQREKMLEFMVAHPDFARHRVTGADAAREKIKLQAELASLLNSCATGAYKSADKWIKCWQDWRSDVKAKVAKIRRAQQQNGGGPRPAPLSAMEESLMAFIGYEAAEGIAVADTLEIPESNIEDSDEGTEHIPGVENTRTTKTQHRLEECLETQAAAKVQLSQSLNNLAAAINNLAAALNSMAITTNKV